MADPKDFSQTPANNVSLDGISSAQNATQVAQVDDLIRSLMAALGASDGSVDFGSFDPAILIDHIDPSTPGEGVEIDGANIKNGKFEGLSIANGVIVDSNGNEVLSFAEVVSAINYLAAQNSATGNAVEIQALGDDTDIDINLVPKGSGTVQIGGTPVISAQPGWEDLDEVVIGAAQANVDFTDLDTATYSVFRVVADNVHPVNDSSAIACRLREEGGSFRQGASDYQYAGERSTTGSTTNIGSSSASEIRLAENVGNAAEAGCGFEATFYAFDQAARYKPVEHHGTTIQGPSSSVLFRRGSGQTNWASAVDGIRFFVSSGGNFDSGRFYLQGIRK